MYESGTILVCKLGSCMIVVWDGNLVMVWVELVCLLRVVYESGLY